MTETLVPAYTKGKRRRKNRTSFNLLASFLRDHLKLELSEEKTLITHARTEKARFLGYHIHTLQEDTQRDDRDQRKMSKPHGRPPSETSTGVVSRE